MTIIPATILVWVASFMALFLLVSLVGIVGGFLDKDKPQAVPTPTYRREFRCGNDHVIVSHMGDEAAYCPVCGERARGVGQ